ncbi:MAG: PEP-CTERM system histidine kinase PrsK [Congregibacter sp.]
MTDNISLITHGAAALAYLAMTVLLLAQRRVQPLGPALVFATTATAAWASLIAVGTLQSYPPISWIQAAELVRNCAWLMFLLQLLSFQKSGNTWRWARRRWLPWFFAAIGLAVGVVALRPLSPHITWLTPKAAADTVLLLWLAVAVAGLLLIEQLYRNARAEERWGIKFLCLGLGALFAYDFVMYAEALLFRTLTAQVWQARGVVTALIVPWLLIASARNRNWRMDIHVSRQVAFHSVTLFATGLYLIAMSIIGYYIKYLGVNWGGVLQVSFLASSSALLFTLLFSGTVRARLRVLLSKHFFSYRYDYREEWLRFTEQLASLTDVAAGVVSTIAPVAMSPGGFLLYRDSSGAMTSVSSWELDAPAVNGLGNLPEWILTSGWVIDLKEWRDEPHRYEGLELPDWAQEDQNLWLIVPLMFKQELEGLLFIASTDLKSSVNWEDRDLLKTVGRQAATLLAQQRASIELVEARQFDAFNRLSAYVIHDLKNILAQQSLIVANAEKHRDNPAFVNDMISTVDNSVKRMQRLMDQMRSGMRASDPRPQKLESLLRGALETRKRHLPLPTMNAFAFDEPVVLADRDRLTTVFGHLVQNAQEATDDDGELSVTLSVEGATAKVTISDSGCGMAEEFVKTKLFKPFESTKGLTGMGIGVFESREYVRQLGGDIYVESAPGHGSTFTVSLPILDDMAA